ncbi:hypothetical protein ONZ45_g9233 [Pleurotus djamor]|nr:hypothetical protein ONZ45_g9233 [Pleurotus djamor]
MSTKTSFSIVLHKRADRSHGRLDSQTRTQLSSLSVALTNGLEYTYSSMYLSQNEFYKGKLPAGFNRSRGLTNDLEYTYSSPSAYTADQGMSSARGKCAHNHAGPSFPERKDFGGVNSPKTEYTTNKRGYHEHECSPEFLRHSRALDRVCERQIPSFRRKTSIYLDRASLILTTYFLHLRNPQIPNQAPYASHTLPYGRLILDFPTYPPFSDQAYKWLP